ncbi:MAG: FUSC family protein, partial [Pusillimonas sp.]|nr:FUSC family protein [Pusillimonas sp.]
AIPLLAQLPAVPTGIQQSLEAINALLEDRNAPVPVSIETEGDLAALAYPIRQMSRAAQLIHQEMQVFETPQSEPRRPAAEPA